MISSSSVGMALELGLITALVVVMLGYRSRALKWHARSQYWYDKSRELPVSVTNEQAVRIMRDLFPRPLGAVPSTERDAANAKAWRQRRALLGSDHKTSVTIDAENHAGNDGWAAHELLLFCCEGKE